MSCLVLVNDFAGVKITIHINKKYVRLTAKNQ